MTATPINIQPKTVYLCAVSIVSKAIGIKEGTNKNTPKANANTIVENIAKPSEKLRNCFGFPSAIFIISFLKYKIIRIGSIICIAIQ